MKRIEQIIAGVVFAQEATSEELNYAKTGIREGWAYAIKELKTEHYLSAAACLGRDIETGETMNKSACSVEQLKVPPLCVGAFLQPRMILERVKKTGGVTDTLYVTAIGEKSFLAIQSDGVENKFKQNDADEFYCTGIEPLKAEA